MGVVHLDVKPHNVVDYLGKVIWIDFGISKILPEGQDFVEVKEVVGTAAFMAPECFHRNAMVDYKITPLSFCIIILV